MYDDDRQLAQDAKSGDERSRQRLAERMQCVDGILVALDRRRSTPFDDGERSELATRVLTGLWRDLAQYEGHTALEAWAYQICCWELSEEVLRRTGARDTTEAPTPDEAAKILGRMRPDVIRMERALRVLGAVWKDEDERRAPGKDGAGGGRRVTLLVMAGVVVVALAALTVMDPWGWFGPPSGAESTDDGVRCTHPVGPVDRYRPFTWTFELPLGGHYEVLVHDAEEGSLLIDGVRVFDARWEPPAEDEVRWSGAIRWTVRAYRFGSPSPIASGSAVARRQ